MAAAFASAGVVAAPPPPPVWLMLAAVRGGGGVGGTSAAELMFRSVSLTAWHPSSAVMSKGESNVGDRNGTTLTMNGTTIPTQLIAFNSQLVLDT